ncbi:MAG TPA: alpha/beta hydrolase [Ilumatobacter sp.]|nr:alpha/beta hydrolase [Ilumatobacter sp.]
MGTTTTSDGATISYDTIGEGRPLVLVHGITESRSSWGSLPESFADHGYRVTSLDLRGHGASSRTAPYDLATMAGDLGAVLADLAAPDALLVGHSLGGAVVSAYAAGGPCRAVVNVDQPLQLAGFQSALQQLEPLLRGTDDEFQQAIGMVFAQMAGPLAGAERDRIDGLRRGEQDVVLGVWEAVLSSSADDLNALVDGLVGQVTVPYLSLHGIDPGAEYGEWLTGKVSSATFEVWPDLGHYPHLIEPAKFVNRITLFDTEAR